MTKTVYGERVGRQGQLRLGCTAVLFNKEGDKVLLTRRADNGEWCLPGGMIEAGESVSEGCAREVWEETRLKVRVIRLTGVYSDPDQLIVYPDGKKAHFVVLNFLVEEIGGEIGLSDETTAVRFFAISEAVQMKLFHSHSAHLRDALAGQEAAFIC